MQMSHDEVSLLVNRVFADNPEMLVERLMQALGEADHQMNQASQQLLKYSAMLRKVKETVAYLRNLTPNEANALYDWQAVDDLCKLAGYSDIPF